MSDFSVKKGWASSKSFVAHFSYLAVTAYHIPLNKENKRTHSNSFVGYSMNRFFLRNHIKKYSRKRVFFYGAGNGSRIGQGLSNLFKILKIKPILNENRYFDFILATIFIIKHKIFMRQFCDNIYITNRLHHE